MRDIANECGGPMFEYLGHFANPTFLRMGHNEGGGMGIGMGMGSHNDGGTAGDSPLGTNANPFAAMEMAPTPVEQPFRPANA